ncbi:UNVERIFIED_ORG: endo-1,4-beta-xylanase [Zoogloea ramigera]|uniref:Beta-xylanase n=1 Tax=Duganella zoogloeoides TaxID=75659 RepID=A0ABZ0XR20_9BURK|nr:endo-1,4-beta-xylanase [Duganella zoogloeoides]WQH02189.1 endo-1,4-beta-xylanase [Duganella zoogloeoides]
MPNRRSVLTMLGGAAGAVLMPAPAFAATSESLKDIAARKGMRFGCAVGRRSEGGDSAYEQLLARECGMIVAENATKWPALQPQPGPHRFAAADQMVAWARERRLLVRGHTLLWQARRWLPDWVNQYDFGAAPARVAERLMTEHIKAVCTHFGRNIFSYDVVNEAVDPKTGELIGNVLNQKMGALEQIDLAFVLARQYAPNAQLVYNDYMGPGAGSEKHRAGVLALLAALRARGTPIDALGLQSHIGNTLPAAATAAGSDWRKFLDQVSDMGYDLLITEFDVNDRQLPADVAARDAGVAAIARDYLDLTLSYPRCRDFLLWGMADHVSWLQQWDDARRADGLPQRCTPYDSDLRPKPLRETIAHALKIMPPRLNSGQGQIYRPDGTS